MKKNECLKDLMVFSRLEDKEIKLICEQARRKNYQKDEMIFIEQDNIKKLYFLVEGRVKLTMMSPDGKEKVVNILHKGDIFGEISFFDHNPQPLTAEVQENCALLVLTRENFELLNQKSPSLTIKIIEALAQKTRLLANQVRELVFQDAEGRLAALIIRFINEFGKESQKGIMINIVLTHQELANLLGTSRVTVTKTVNNFINEGIIKIIDRKIVVINPEKLKEKANKIK